MANTVIRKTHRPKCRVRICPSALGVVPRIEQAIPVTRALGIGCGPICQVDYMKFRYSGKASSNAAASGGLCRHHATLRLFIIAESHQR
eukprot:scaffold1583_cov299-Pinguiococcus_pyrenoidosus.AAC.1